MVNSHEWQPLRFTMDNHVLRASRRSARRTGKCVSPLKSRHVHSKPPQSGHRLSEYQMERRLIYWQVRCFRPELNLKRLHHSCLVAGLPCPSLQLFLEAIEAVVEDNMDFVPPYESDGAMYIRPAVFGAGPQVGLVPSEEVHFMIYCNPVGEYYKSGVGPFCAFLMRFHAVINERLTHYPWCAQEILPKPSS